MLSKISTALFNQVSVWRLLSLAEDSRLPDILRVTLSFQAEQKVAFSPHINAYLTPLHRNSILTWPFIYALLCKSCTVKIRYLSILFRFYVATSGLQRMAWQCGCQLCTHPAKIQPHEADSATSPSPSFLLSFSYPPQSFAFLR